MNVSSVEKSIFPRLLKRLFDSLAPTAKNNAINGFAACGIFPLSESRLLSRIPQEPEEDQPQNHTVKDVLVDYLKSQRNPNKRDSTVKRKRLNIIPGKSVAADDSPDKEQPGPSSAKNKVKCKITQRRDDSESESEFEDIMETQSESHHSEEEIEEIMETESENKPEHIEENCDEIKEGSWVLVPYYSKKYIKHFVGRVTRIHLQEAEIKFLKYMKNSKFVWPNTEDCDTLSLEDIIRHLQVPKMGRRGEFYFQEDFSQYNIQ